eukprot:scaffold2489_cov259-Pinguiococcus_pyrenoidosus.AAC.3
MACYPLGVTAAESFQTSHDVRRLLSRANDALLLVLNPSDRLLQNTEVHLHAVYSSRHIFGRTLKDIVPHP